MPKIFRPTLKQQPIPPKSIEHAKEKLVDNTEPQTQLVVESPVLDSSIISKPVIETDDAETKNIAASVVGNNPTDLDLDVDLAKPPASNSTSRDVKPRIKLFVAKKKRRPRNKVTEPLPSADEPLNRSSVTLRSLLNWVPLNKPPPIYRQERSNIPNIKDVDDTPNPTSTPTSPNKDVKMPSVFKPSPDKCAASEHMEEDYIDPLAPQLRLDADGNIVLDETSLVVKQTPLINTKDLKHVVEETGILGATYRSFKRRPDRFGGKWTEQETVRFYRALTTMGTDFYSMEKLFPNRTRPELKRKYKREEKINPYLVNQALRNRRTYDVTSLIPLSDEDEDEEDLTDTKAATQDSNLRKRKKSDETKTNSANLSEKPKRYPKFPQIEHPKRRRPPAVACNPAAKSLIMETIDSVLNQTDAYLNQSTNPASASSASLSSIVNQENTIPSEYRDMFANLDDANVDDDGKPDQDAQTTPIKCNQSLLEKMIADKEAELAAVQQSFVIEDLNPSILNISEIELPSQMSTNTTLLDCQIAPQIDLVKLCKDVLGQD